MAQGADLVMTTAIYYKVFVSAHAEHSEAGKRDGLSRAVHLLGAAGRSERQ
jgi:hypothetical protein